MDTIGAYIDGAWTDAAAGTDVLDKFTGDPIAHVAATTPGQIEDALAGAATAVGDPLPPGRRSQILLAAADLLVERHERIIASYVAETGFTPADAAGELDRAAQVFRLSANEALRLAGEEIPVAATPGSEGRLAFTMRIPVGVVAAIAPFNAPLNTVAHKIAPAIAAGNSVLLKPAEATPLSSAELVRALSDAGLPPGYLQFVPGSGRTVGAAVVSDPRVRYVTFTGSTAVGRQIAAASGLARTHLELGANSATIVCADADLELVASLTARGGFRKAGQVCTSVQRLLVHRKVADELGSQLGARVEALRAGDPRLTGIDVGPMISAAEAERAESWIAGSVGRHTRVVGSGRDGSVLRPTLVIEPSAESRLLHEEIFAPVVALIPVESTDEAIAIVNSGQYGLQTGIFTRDLDRAFDAARRLRVGGVIVNDTSSYHADLMPYGGVKESGHGVEGPAYAVRDMTDPRVVVLNLRPPSEDRA